MSASIAVVDDASTWAINPANLANLANKTPAEGKVWANDVMAGYGRDSDYADGLAASWSGWDEEDAIGAGFGTFDLRSDYKAFGAGIGKRVGDSPLSIGANFVYYNGDGSELDVNAGLLYQFACGLRAGAVVEDIFDASDNGPYLHLGLAYPVATNLLVAADIWDVTEQTDSTNVDGGVEWTVSDTFKLRAGLMDTEDGH